MSYSIFINLVEELVKNLPESNETQKLDLILDNGAFNGLYLYGMALYLKNLEAKGRIKINRISGSSIGSFIAILYLTDKLDISKSVFDKMRGCWKEHMNLYEWKEVIKNYIENELTMDIINSKINGRIFINYFNTKTCKETIKSVFDSKEELLDTLYKSSFIPILSNGDLAYNDCIDGFNPSLFDERTNEDNKCLFIHLLNLDKVRKVLNVSTDKNLSFRTIEGINEVHKFFLGDNQTMCSYINDWSAKQLFYFRCRQIIYYFIVYIIKLLIILKSYIPETVYDMPIYNLVSQISRNLFKDVVLKTCF